MSHTMPKEMQTAYQRWEMASFGDERPSARAARNAPQAPAPLQEAAPQLMLPTVEELENLREAARSEGYAAGREAGYADGQSAGAAQANAEAQEERAQLRALAATFSGAVAAADETIAADVLDLALHLARSMVCTTLTVRPELIIPIVREAIDYLPILQQPAILALNPDDIEIVRTALSDELNKGGWRVVADPQVGRGGCKVDTASNQIDAQASTRWARLAHALGKNVEWLA